MVDRTSIFVVAMVCVGAMGFMPGGCGGEPGEREYKAGISEIEHGNYVRGRALLEKSVNKRPGSDYNPVAHHYMGVASYKLGQVQQAIESFEQSRLQNPNLPETAYNLGILLFEGGDIWQAASLLEQSARMNPADTRPLEYLAQVYIRNEKWAEARRVLFEALGRNPQSVRILSALAVTEYFRSGPDMATFYLMQALEKKSDYPPALYDLGVICMREGKNTEQAAAYLKKYLEVAPKDAHAEFAGKALQDLQQPVAAVPSAVTRAEAVTQATAKAEAPPPESRSLTVDEMLKEAQTLAHGGEMKKALNLCIEASEKAGRAQDVGFQEKALRAAVKLCPNEAKAHQLLGKFQLDHNQNEVAMQSFKKAVELGPKIAAAQRGLAEAASRNGEYDTTLVALKQALQLEPANADAVWSLAVLYDEQLELPDKALQTYRQFAKLFPSDPRVVKANDRLKSRQKSMELVSEVAEAPAEEPEIEPATVKPVQQAPGSSRTLRYTKPVVRNTRAAVQAYNRGALYQEKEDWERAVYYYTRALENDDSFVNAFYNLGTVFWEKGDLDLAKDAYLHALQLQPQMMNARYNLALILRDRKERDAAIEQLQTILVSNPNYAQAYYTLGLLYAENETTIEKAKQYYIRYLELAPNDSSAGTVRQWLAAHGG